MLSRMGYRVVHSTERLFVSQDGVTEEGRVVFDPDERTFTVSCLVPEHRVQREVRQAAVELGILPRGFSLVRLVQAELAAGL
jgi:hypothetical protein